MVNTFVGTLEFAKVLITIFIMFYAYFFLRKAEDYEERRPWMYLFIGAMFLFLVEVIATLQLFRGGLFHDQFFIDLKQFLEFGFLAFFLFSFIYQHHMLLQKGVLLIEEKSEKKEKKGRDWWEKVKQEYLWFEEKAEKVIDGEEEGGDPEEELKEELESLDEDQELKKEEDEIERLVEETEKDD